MRHKTKLTSIREESLNITLSQLTEFQRAKGEWKLICPECENEIKPEHNDYFDDGVNVKCLNCPECGEFLGYDYDKITLGKMIVSALKLGGMVLHG